MATAGVVVDTSIIIRHLRTPLSRQNATTLAYVYWLTDCYVTYITVYELYLGATDRRKTATLAAVLSRLRFLKGTARDARRGGVLHRHLLRHGWDIGAMDSLIAAACLEADLPILTANTDHFLRVPGLVVLSPDRVTPGISLAQMVTDAWQWNAAHRRKRGYDRISAL